MFWQKHRIVIANNSPIYDVVSIENEHIRIASAPVCKVTIGQYIIPNIIIRSFRLGNLNFVHAVQQDSLHIGGQRSKGGAIGVLKGGCPA